MTTSSRSTVKHAVADQIIQELIFESFANYLENNKIYSAVKSAVNSFLGINRAA